MGSAASVARLSKLSKQELYRAAEESGVPEVVRQKIIDEEIDGATVVEFTTLPEDALGRCMLGVWLL